MNQFARLLVAAAMITSSYAVWADGTPFAVGNWDGKAYWDRSGAFQDCTASTFFPEKMSGLIISVDREHNVGVSVFRNNWNLAVASVYTVAVSVDNVVLGQKSAESTTPQTVLIKVGKEAPFLASLERGTVISINTGNEVLQFELSDIHQLFSSLDNCVAASTPAEAPRAAHVQSAQQIAKQAFGSTVLLVMEDANGQPLSLGSGFFVRDGEIATNVHVIEGASRGYAKLVGQKAKYDIEGVTAIDTKRDLVLLKITFPGAPALALGSSDTVEVGESVYAVGNPEGLEGTFSQGIVSSIRDVGADKLLQITAPISPGSSGGPVLNAKGEVIGVSVATYREGQNLNFAIPANYLKTLLGRAGPPVALKAAKPATAQRSMLGELGGKSTQGVVGANLTYDGSAAPGYGNATGEYSFSLVNKLREPVHDIYCVVVFYDQTGQPLDAGMQHYTVTIPGGLAKRVAARVDETVEKLNNPTPPFPHIPVAPRKGVPLISVPKVPVLSLGNSSG